MSSQLIQLLDVLVDDIYGDVPRILFHTLLEYPHLTLPELVRQSTVEPRWIKPALALLLQRGLVNPYPLDEYGVTRYTANAEQAYLTLRAGKYLQLVEDRTGNPATVEPLMTVLLNGRATYTQVADSCDPTSFNDTVWHTLLGNDAREHGLQADRPEDVFAHFIRQFKLHNAVPAKDFDAILTRMIVSEDSDFQLPIKGPKKEQDLAEILAGKKLLVRDHGMDLAEPKTIASTMPSATNPPRNALAIPQSHHAPIPVVGPTQAHFRPVQLSVEQLRQIKEQALNTYDHQEDILYQSEKRSFMDRRKAYGLVGLEFAEADRDEKMGKRRNFLSGHHMAAEAVSDPRQMESNFARLDQEHAELEIKRLEMIRANEESRARRKAEIDARRQQYSQHRQNIPTPKPSKGKGSKSRENALKNTPAKSTPTSTRKRVAASPLTGLTDGKKSRISGRTGNNLDIAPMDTSSGHMEANGIEDAPGNGLSSHLSEPKPLGKRKAPAVIDRVSKRSKMEILSKDARSAPTQDSTIDEPTSNGLNGHTNKEVHASVASDSQTNGTGKAEKTPYENSNDSSEDEGTQIRSAKRQQTSNGIRSTNSGSELEANVTDTLQDNPEASDDVPKSKRRKKSNRSDSFFRISANPNSVADQHVNYFPSVHAHSTQYVRVQAFPQSAEQDQLQVYFNPREDNSDDLNFEFDERDNEPLFFVDHEKLNVCFRSDALAELCSCKLGPTPSRVYHGCLKYLEERIERCYEPFEVMKNMQADLEGVSDDDNDTRSNLSTHRIAGGKVLDGPSFAIDDVLAYISHEADLAPFCAKAEDLDDDDEAHEEKHSTLEVTKEDEDDERAMNRRKRKADSSDPWAISEDAKYEAVEAIFETLSCDPTKFLTKVNSPRGHRQLFKINFGEMASTLIQFELEAYAAHRLGPLAARIIRALKHLGKLDAQQVAMSVLAPVRQVNTTLLELSALAFIEVQEIPKDNRRGGAMMTIYMSAWDVDRCRRNVLDDCYKMMSRQLLYLRHVRRLHRNVLEKAERTDVKDREAEMLKKHERDELARVAKIEDAIWLEVTRLDDVVMRLRDFLPIKHPE